MRSNMISLKERIYAKGGIKILRQHCILCLLTDSLKATLKIELRQLKKPSAPPCPTLPRPEAEKCCPVYPYNLTLKCIQTYLFAILIKR